MSFITDVQSGKPGHFGSEFFMAKRMTKIKWPKDGHTFTFNFEIRFQDVFAIFLAFAASTNIFRAARILSIKYSI